MIVGGKDFAPALEEALASVTTVDVTAVAESPEELSGLSESVQPDVLLVENALAHAVDSSVPAGRAVLAPWIATWRTADATSGVSRADIAVVAAMLASLPVHSG